MGPLSQQIQWHQFSTHLFAPLIFEDGGTIPNEMSSWAPIDFPKTFRHAMQMIQQGNKKNVVTPEVQMSTWILYCEELHDDHCLLAEHHLKVTSLGDVPRNRFTMYLN